jgi:hypothetical protein
MYRFIQKHGKKLMAVFSVFLMISFAATGLTGNRAGRNPVVGSTDGEKVRYEDVVHARGDWQVLSKIPGPRGMPLTSLLGTELDTEINRNPVLFVLLQKEAERMGVTVANDSLQSMLTNTPGLITPDRERNAQISRAVRGLLLVYQGAQRASSVVKITEPMVQHQLAQIAQSISVNLIDFTTAKYLDQAKGTEPTAEQIKQQFEKYADTVPGTVTDQNPFGFGYRYPDRVKLQYIVVPRSDVRRAVESSRTPYEWDVEARKYYRQNPVRFRNDPTTQVAQPLDITAGAKPATKPYDEVAQEAKDTLINDETTRRMNAIRDRLVSTLGSDWVAYRNAVNAAGAGTPSATAPATSVAADSSQGVPYNTFEYLQKLAQQIQANKQLGVLPTAVSIADRWLTPTDINNVAGIGQATLDGAPLGAYVATRTLPFIPEQLRKDQSSSWLHVMEPTRPLTDTSDSIYIARISAAEPSHKPANIAEVELQLKQDLLTVRAYELAKADATKALDVARQAGLKAAAGGKPVVSAGPLTARPGQVVAPLALTGEAANRFVARAFKLLSPTASTQPSGVAPTTAAVATTQGVTPGKSIDLVELPRDGRVLVAELTDVQAMWTQRDLPMHQVQIQNVLSDQFEQGFRRGWFNYDSVIARTKWVPDADMSQLLGSSSGGSGNNSPAQAPPPPIF